MKCKVNIQNDNNYSNAPNQFVIQRYVNTTLEKEQDNIELTLKFVDKNEIQQLNMQYRKLDKPTNVLSFPSELPLEIQSALDAKYLGDIIICHQVVCEEAANQLKSLDAHYAHMIVHGVLHLLGYDHINAEDAQIMEPLEIEILSKLGYSNPYEPQ